MLKRKVLPLKGSQRVRTGTFQWLRIVLVGSERPAVDFAPTKSDEIFKQAISC